MPSNSDDPLLNADLHRFMMLSPDEITISCQDGAIQQQIINQFNNIETLVQFAIDTTPAQFNAMLTVIMPAFVEKLLHSPKNMVTLLNAMDAERCQVICSAMKSSMRVIIPNAIEFTLMLEPLAPEQRIQVFQTMQDYLPGMVKDMDDFNNVLRSLGIEQRVQFFELMKNNLPGMFFRKFDLLKTFTFLSLELIKNSLPNIINSIYDFQDVMKYHNIQERAQIFEVMKGKLPDFSNDMSSFEDIVEFLDVEQRVQVVEIIKHRLPGIINSLNDLFVVLEHHNAAQSNVILEVIKDSLPEIIKKAIGFNRNRMPGSLDFEKFKVIFEAMKDGLTDHIKDVSDFVDMFKELDVSQLFFVIEAMEGKLTELINGSNVAYVFRKLSEMITKLSPDEILSFLKKIKKILPWTLINSELLLQMFKYYFTHPEQRLFILEAVQDALPELIPIEKFDDFVTQHFPDALQKQKVKQVYFVSLLQELHDKFNEDNISECGLFQAHRAPSSYSPKDLENQLKGKDAIIQLSSGDELFYVAQNMKKITQIVIMDGKKSDFKCLCKNMSYSYKLADNKELKLITSLMGRTHIQDNDKRTLQTLYNSLQHSSQLYFNQQPSESNYLVFQKSCNQALNIARKELKAPHIWKDILAIIGLAIVSLGVIPIVLSVVSKINTGNWAFSLFKAESERKMDDIARSVSICFAG